MSLGPRSTPSSKQKGLAQRTIPPQQLELLQKCSQIFSNEGEINQAALDDLLTFLSKENLNELDFNDVISVGSCKGAPVLGVLALAASSGFSHNLDKVIYNVDIKRLNFNFQCPSYPSIFQGYTVLHLLMHASAYGRTRCLEHVFSEIPLKNLNFKAKCNEGLFQGTDVFWMAALAAARGHRQYLDKILNKVPIKDLEINVSCQRPIRRVVTANSPSAQLNPTDLLSLLFSQLVLTSAEIDEPFSGESTLHLLAQVAAQGKPEYLKTILRRMTLTPELLNQKILEGPNKGATLFHLIAESEARALEPQGILEEIPNKVLLQLDLNSVVEGGESEGTTALYWLAVAAGNGRPNCLDKVIAKKPHSELNLRVMGKGRDCRDLTILDWLTRAVCFGHPKALEKLMAIKAYHWKDFNVKNGWGITPLFYLARGACNGHLKVFETILSAASFDELDFNSKYIGKNGYGTTLLWWLAMLAIDGKAQYLEHLLAMVPLEMWDLDATCETGVNEGWSVLHLIAEAANRGHSQVLARILTQLPSDKLNLMRKISSGECKGLTVFHQICQAANNGNTKYLDIVLDRNDLLRKVDFNCRCEEGSNQGTTPLWWACAAATKDSSAQLEKILSKVPIGELDFNATCTKGPYKGISAFQLVVRAAARGNIKPLEILFERLNLNQVQFNLICKRGEFHGATTLWWICLLAASGRPEFLERLLEKVPINQLNFNLPCLEGVNEGITPFWWVICAAKHGNRKSLDIIFQQIPVKQLIENQIQNKNHNVIFLLAWCGYANIIESYFNDTPITEIDINAKATSGDFKGTSLLWWLAVLAANGHPACFEKVLAGTPLDLLNFNVRSDQSGKSLKEVINGTRWSSYVEFLSYLQRIKSLLNRQENINSLLDELDSIAAKAQADGHADTYYVLARFFQSFQNQELFRKYAQKVPADHLNSNEIILELDRLGQPLNPALSTSNNESSIEFLSIQQRDSSHSDLDSLNAQLGRLLTEPPIDAMKVPVTETASIDPASSTEPVPSSLIFRRAISEFLPSSFSIESSPVDVPKKVKWRSKDAQELHSLVMRACKSKNAASFLQILEKLDKYLVNCKVDALAELSINGFSHLDDVLHLPFEKQSDPLFAEYIANNLFAKLSMEMQSKLPKEKFAQILSNGTNKGFVLLQDALRSGSVSNTQMIIKLSESALDQKTWQVMLRSKNHFGYNGFQQAVGSGKLGLVKSFIMAVQSAFGDKSDSLLRELGSESWRFFNSGAWKTSQEQMEIKALIDPFVNFKRSSQRIFC